MPSSRYYRFKTFSEEEKAKRKEAFLFWFFFTAGFLTILWSFFLSPFFKITEIKISQSDIIEIDNVLGRNLLLLNSGNLKASLASVFPEITDIVIKKKLFNTLNIDFKKRIQIGIWCPEGAPSGQVNCYYFDEEGIIYKEAPISEGSLILRVVDLSKSEISKGERALSETDLNFIINFSNVINKSDKIKIVEFKIKPITGIDLEAVTGGNWLVYLDSSQDPNLAANNLITTVNEAVKNQIFMLEYIDLRIPSRIFYKIK